ncbi:prepilin-type N-terminal cleavage/methylation domain-containing protein [Alienimonas californiensis]|uniref:Type II secretion system protein J n=1 Tax=Alienimonas californiensis TaxID=2527989 RepID=A0A517PDV8_9PLAN|nr:prepilin-type N-terminal cleavage/methylation domain-containing protein [Alienimonas californiensis]QDT17568.1 general secretion pathway protein J [Alienimonas californiensis]
MNRTPRRRSGFTLIEVLLAMALLVVVLAGVYAGLETFRRVTTMGRDAATEQQLVRAIRSRLLTDVRSLRFAPPRALPDETSADDSGDDPADLASAASSASSSSSGAEPTEPAEELFPVPQVGVTGDAETLTLYTALPPRGIADEVTTGPAARTSDLRTVTWFLAGRGGAVSSGVAERDGEGLARSEGDTAAVALAEDTGDLPGLTDAARLLAPEVTGLSFRYFDGAEWVTSWDSSLTGSLPRAIEVTLEIDLDGAPNPYATGQELGNRGPSVTRLVICPPLSEPSAEALL